MSSRRRNIRDGGPSKGSFLDVARSLTQQLLELERLRGEVRKAEQRHEQMLAKRASERSAGDGER